MLKKLKPWRQVMRLWKIQRILFRYRLDDLVLTTPLLHSLHFVRYLNFHQWRKSFQPLGVRIRLALEELGPIFVKFGQALSTRRDLLPEDIADELSKLQDKVAPFDTTQAIKIIEQEFKKPLATIFKSFNKKPLAAASIAQVYEAELHEGHDVIVKVLRPDVDKQIQQDIDLLYFLAKIAERYFPEAKRLHAVEVVAEFDQTIHDELDLSREAANASQLKRNFAHSELLYVPEIYWSYVHHNILVMERIHGIPISDIDSLRKHGINLKALSERGVEIFFTQVFRDCFFHADMHPGNLFVDPHRPDEPRYLGVDFGIMGSLSSADQRYLAENLLAFFNRDYRRVAELHVQSGWVPANTRVDAFEAAIRTVCEPIFERPLSEISFGQMLLKLFQTARRFNMEVQPQLVLLQKTLFNIEGLGRQLYPDLDLWTTAKPFLEKWMRTQVGPQAFLRKVKQNLPIWLEQMPDLPELFYQRLNTPKTANTVIIEKTRPIRLGFLSGLMVGVLSGAVGVLLYWHWLIHS